MGRLMKSFFFKLSRDVTFRVTLIIGVVLALAINLLLFALQSYLANELGEGFEGIKFISGQGMLITSMSPIQNFGIVIPINLIIFTCLEFSQGTIRNKIIAGNSKLTIYSSLLLTGLVFALSLLAVYILLCTGLGAIFGGFNLNDRVFSGLTGSRLTAEYLIKMSIICLVTYTCIVSVTIFFAALFRSIGPCIPVILILLFGCYYIVTIIQTVALFLEESQSEVVLNVLRIVDPLYAIASNEVGYKYLVDGAGNYVLDDYGEKIVVDTFSKMNDVTFYGGIANNLIYGGLFFMGGALIFTKRDIK